MRTRFCLFLALLAPLLGLSPGLSQPPPGKGPSKEPKPVNEEEKVRDGIKEALKAQETERDKLLKELQKLPWPRNPAGGDEFSLWFEVLTGGRGVWVAAEKPKLLREFFERVVGRLGITDGRITRDQFLRYARHYLTEGASPPWKPPSESGGHLAEATKAFRQLDRSGDGLLNYDELSDTLRAERNQWDVNRDGFIDLREYTTYFEGRMRQMWGEGGGGPSPPAKGPNTPAPSPPAEEGRPVIHRYGKLPAELPAWFTQLDNDRDAQLGLYEWRRSGRPLGEFEKMDRNNDGFLTAEELLCYLRAGGSPDDPRAGKGGSPKGSPKIPDKKGR